MKDELIKLVGPSEKILYEGKPNKKCYVFESIFNPLLIFAFIWGAIDLTLITSFLSVDGFMDDSMGFFMIPFFLLHLMPVWIYLVGVLLTVRKYKNTYYIVTDRAVYVSGGIISKTFNTKPFAELSHVDLHRGFFDQRFNVGDVILTSNQIAPGVYNGNAYNTRNGSAGISINSISNYAEVYNLVKKLQQDIYTDIMYPNDKRPAENHGYNTEYKGL